MLALSRLHPVPKRTDLSSVTMAQQDSQSGAARCALG